jgi:hypothetical protein
MRYDALLDGVAGIDYTEIGSPLRSQTMTNFSGQLTDFKTLKKFMFAGNATITLVSKRTGSRYTYKVSAPKNKKEGDKPIWFVSLLTGADNESSYSYFGNIYSSFQYQFGRKSKINRTNESIQAWEWFYNLFDKGMMPAILDKCEVWHEGRCGRCNRKLTVPSSISSGFGPECARFI